MLNYCITSWLKTYGYPTVLSNRLLFLCLYDFGSRLVVPCLFMCFKFRSCCLGYSKPVPRNTHNYLYNTVFPINRFLKTSLFLPLSEQTKNSQNHINPKTTRSNKSHMFTLWYKRKVYMHNWTPFPSFSGWKKNEGKKGLPKDGELKQNSSLFQTSSTFRPYNTWQNPHSQTVEALFPSPKSHEFSFCDAK